MSMLTRRAVLRSLVWATTGLAAEPLLASCGQSNRSDGRQPAATGTIGLAAANVSREQGSVEARPAAVNAVQALTADLYRSLAVTPGNLVCSPYSVAVALAMTRNGARGSTARQMDEVLHAPPLDRFNAGLNALTRLVESRAGEQVRADHSKGTVSLDVANSLWGQRDTSWEPAFLAALARSYGAGMRLVDFISQPEAARTLINGWTADRTHDRITDIIPAGVLDALTRLVLVNAIYLKAPWEEPFLPKLTQRRPFQLSDGSVVDADTMTGSLKSASFAAGPGWRAAQLPYAGRKLAMTVIVPDQPNSDRLDRFLDRRQLNQMMTSVRPVPLLSLQLPRWRFRLQIELRDHLAALGMPIAFDPFRADFTGMTAEEQLYISHVLHQAFIAVDEEGTEAAAATALVMSTLSMPPATVLNVDRPFLFVIHDIDTATPLFIGRVSDPTT
jgi:serpin B